MIAAVQFLCVLVVGESSLNTGDNGRAPRCSHRDEVALVHGFSDFPTATYKASCIVTLTLGGIAESFLEAFCLCL